METIVHMNETYWGKSAAVVVRDGRGFTMVSIIDKEPSVAVVHDLTVHESVRGIGLGNGILKMAEELSMHMGADRVRLSVEPGSWQEGWYKRHGYHEEGLVDFEGYDCLVLEKEIRREMEEPQIVR